MSKRYAPRDAVAIARRLGWNVVTTLGPSGSLVFTAPDGRRFLSRPPGRCSRVPLQLAKALTAAEAAKVVRS